jgi:hypothetical protein
MARFLVVPIPVAGHVCPALTPCARYRLAVERAGATLAPFHNATDFDLERLTELCPDRPQKPGLRQVFPDGFGVAPSATAVGQLRNRRANQLVNTRVDMRAPGRPRHAGHHSEQLRRLAGACDWMG